MPNVLGAVEHAEGESRKEVPWGEVTRHRPELESRLALEIDTHILQLGNVVLAVATVLLQLRPVVHVLRHSMQHVEAVELQENGAPLNEKFQVAHMNRCCGNRTQMQSKTYQVFTSSGVYCTRGMGLPLNGVVFKERS